MITLSMSSMLVWLLRIVAIALLVVAGHRASASTEDDRTLEHIYELAYSGAFDRALSELRRVEPENDEDRYLALTLEASLLQELNRYAESAKALRMAIATNPGVTDDYVNLATALTLSQQPGLALEVLVEARGHLGPKRFNELSEIDVAGVSPDEVALFLALADAYEQREERDQALLALEEGYLRNSGDADLFDRFIDLRTELHGPLPQALIESLCRHVRRASRSCR